MRLKCISNILLQLLLSYKHTTALRFNLSEKRKTLSLVKDNKSWAKYIPGYHICPLGSSTPAVLGFSIPTAEHLIINSESAEVINLSEAIAFDWSSTFNRISWWVGGRLCRLTRGLCQPLRWPPDSTPMNHTQPPQPVLPGCCIARMGTWQGSGSGCAPHSRFKACPLWTSSFPPAWQTSEGMECARAEHCVGFPRVLVICFSNKIAVQS